MLRRPKSYRSLDLMKGFHHESGVLSYKTMRHQCFDLLSPPSSKLLDGSK